MNKLWRWIQKIDLGTQSPDCREGNSLPSYGAIDEHSFKQAGLGSTRTPLSWRRRSPGFFSPSLPLPPTPKRCRSEAPPPKFRARPAIALSLSVLALTAAMGQRYYRQPELQVGTISPKTILAPDDADVVDQESTEARRTAARNGAVPVLVPNQDANQRITNSLDNLLQQAEILRKQASDFPLVDGRQLPTATQTYIREASAQAWDPIWSVVTAAATDVRDADDDEISTSPLTLLARRSDFQALNAEQQKVARDLVRYQQLQSAMELESLQIVLETARDNFRTARKKVQELAQVDRGLPNNLALLRLSDAEWRTLRQQVRRTLDLMLLQGIPEGVPSDLLAIAASRHLQGQVSTAGQGLGQELIIT
ncbi:MAG: hypothetical protein AAF892_12055, partial [Cyanobacteria bacterium P01_D01_bin.71]